MARSRNRTTSKTSPARFESWVPIPTDESGWAISRVKVSLTGPGQTRFANSGRRLRCDSTRQWRRQRGVCGRRLRHGGPDIVVRTELPDESEPECAQTNNQRQQDYCPDVRNERDATRRQNYRAGSDCRSDPKRNPKQTIERDFAGVIRNQRNRCPKSFQRQTAPTIHDRDHKMRDQRPPENEQDEDNRPESDHANKVNVVQMQERHAPDNWKHKRQRRERGNDRDDKASQ